MVPNGAIIRIDGGKAIVSALRTELPLRHFAGGYSAEQGASLWRRRDVSSTRRSSLGSVYTSAVMCECNYD